MWAEEYLRFSVSQSFLPFPFSPSRRPLKANAERAGKCVKGSEQEGTEQDGGGGEGGVGRKRKKAMYSAFVLIIPPRLGDIQAASVPRLGFGRRVISGSAGERLQRSSISRVLRRRVEGEEERGGGEGAV